jgi:Zn-dependent peptidase ImmA (M78 family)
VAVAGRIGYARERARKLVVGIDMSQLPVDMRNVCEKLGMQYVEVDGFPPKLSALCVEHANTIYAAVNRAHHPKRKRFSLAHEIGHWVLGHTRQYDNEGVTVDTPPDPSLMEVRNKDQEKEANEFAGELLVPLRLLKEAFPKHQDIEDLAEFFGVSKEVITIRLIAAKLV